MVNFTEGDNLQIHFVSMIFPFSQRLARSRKFQRKVFTQKSSKFEIEEKNSC